MGNEINLELLSRINSLQKTNQSQTIVVNGQKINIGELLNHKPSQTNNENKANVISKEKYTYGKLSGVLIKYDDGTAVFQSMKKQNNNIIVQEYHFNKEKDIEKKKPTSVVSYNQKDPKNKVTQSFEYHRNGKLSRKRTTNAQGTLIRDIEFNRNGKPEEVKLYDKKGALIKDQKYKYNKDHSVEISSYNKDNKLESITKTQYAEDGKTRISSEKKDAEGNLIAESKYDENGKISNSRDYYKNGQVKAETEYYDNGVIKTQVQYDQNGKEIKRISPEIDGNFGDSRQVSEGDCYLLASINSIRNTENGQEMLNDLVTVSTNEKGEKVYTVEFPGAKIAAEGLKTDSRIDPNKMYITGKYTFTESEMQEILKQAGKRYSLGDGDVILLEAAFEKYRQEVDQTMDANNIDKKKFHIGEAGLQTGANEDNILAGGRPEDAVFVLTGKQSELYMNKNIQNGLSYEALQVGEADIVSMRRKNNMLSAKAVSQIDGEITDSQKELNKMLDDIMNDPKDGKNDKIAVASFAVVHKDGSVGGHALTIKSVTADTVTLVNPWHPDKEVTMTRQEFLNSARSVSISDVNKAQAQVNGGGNDGGTTPVSNPHQQNNNGQANPVNNSNIPQPNKVYTVPKGATYTNIIKSALLAQGIELTPENIKKAKAQFKAANPGAVRNYKGKRQEWRGNEFLLANAKVKIPQFEM